MNQPLNKLPENFRDEEKKLLQEGLSTWEEIKNLENKQIAALAENSLCTIQNFNRLRGMASLICAIQISQQDAALLMHSGIASLKALAGLTPEQLVRQTGRLERQLIPNSKPSLELAKAHHLIKQAKSRQMLN